MITNTTKQEARPEWLMGGNPSAIENQEARGQQELCESTQLPTRVLHGDKSKLEEAGVKFGEPCKDDPIFCNAELPEGWKVEPTEHSMWSKLVDAEGKERAMIFYKAAFYDRHAFLNVSE
ncbi:MAG: hypothetical protein AAF555_05725 [Verrucomicrobiota bacterium]